ncbi:zinc finger C2HC domain-containing protein 1B isoform X2 [Protopterus annectens]|uniref:zinc finger C2HC domain-containing protein 1B isoform X2 n=1 Tax=Protopterus annectens TaxID=7888 RepID=UPI001CFB7748|nr:zinc finger C2HC domain-containing protein 1B isoform X2 [Protopterus annectens]
MSVNQTLTPCNVCGRTFFPETLSKHQPICKKLSNKQRKVFDSSKQRAEGTEIITVKKRSPPKQPVKKCSWRQQHEDFISSIRSAKLATTAIKEGRPLPPPPPPTINPDYIQCPYCLRRFNEAAAERHINFCKDQAARRAVNKPPVKTPNKPPGKTQPSTPKKTDQVRSTTRQNTMPKTQSKPITGGNNGNTAVKSAGAKEPSSRSVLGKGATNKPTAQENRLSAPRMRK